MPRLIEAPSIIQAAGTKPKRIEEYVGRVNSGHNSVSVARMRSPSGWVEPGQRPAFEEMTIVLNGMVRVEHEGGSLDVRAGQAVITAPVSGFVTALPRQMGLSMSRCVCPRSPPI